MGGTPRLLEQARLQQAGFFVMFGGQGSGWLQELAEHWKDPALRPTIELGLRAIEEELPRFEGSIALPNGFQVRRWLDDPESVPSDHDMSLSAISVPMIFLTQIAALVRLDQRGFPTEALLEHTRGIAGHSQGLFTSGLVALARRGADWDEAYAQFTKYVFYLGARSQETHPYPLPTAEEQDRTDRMSDRAQAPSPMVALLSGTHAEVESEVAAFNKRLPLDKRIFVSLYNAPSSRILASYRSSLVAFHEAHAQQLSDSGRKYIYIRTTCPFHSPHMEPIRPRVEADIARIRFGYPGAALQVPVYSFFDGRNLQDDEEISIQMYLDILINPLHYQKVLRPIVEDDRVTHVIDLGPGTESQRLNKAVLQGLGCKKPVLSACSRDDLAKLLSR